MAYTPNQIKTAEALKPILAETVQLYVLTQNVHWNVTGPLFQSIHLLTEEQYTELATAVDEIAERIRMLGQKAPASLKAYQELGGIPDGDENATAEVMVKALADAHSYIASRIRPLISNASEGGDEVTAGLLTDRLTVHEKAHWILGATIA
ncbi:MAG: DNA starvation/stationary phase protection protein [Kordiimonadales bacterium]|nr:MAG: DNA starvation/stationary phase protection protein [Kordiimonadales bacterium]